MKYIDVFYLPYDIDFTGSVPFVIISNKIEALFINKIVF